MKRLGAAGLRVVQSLMTMRCRTRRFSLGLEFMQRSMWSQKALGASQ